MNIKFIDQYTADDMNNASVKAKLAEVFKASDTFDLSCSFGLDLHDPAGSLAALPVSSENVSNVRVYHCCFVPDESTLQEANTYDELCAEIGENLTAVCYQIALSSPVAFTIHICDGFRIDVVFSNGNTATGTLDEYNLNYLLYNIRDIA